VITRQKEHQEWFKRSIAAVRRWLRAQPRVKKFSATFILDDAWDDWAEGSEWTEECDNGDELVVACLNQQRRARPPRLPGRAAEFLILGIGNRHSALM
jgi:hypothetical protein